MSASLTNGIRNVVSDAVPDPPRFPSDVNNDNADKNEHFKESQTQSRENEIPRVDDSNTSPSADAGAKDDSTASNADARDGSAKSTFKPKKASKSKKPTTSAICLNIVNSTNVKIGPKVKNVYNFNNIQHHNGPSNHNKCGPDSEPTDCKRDMLPHVKALSSSKLQITRDDMLLVKTHLGHGWKQVARDIGYSRGQIEQFLENYQHRDEVIYQILLDWKQSCTKNATIGRLVSVMWDSKEYECVELLAGAHCSP